jgi:hypothetical protein
MDVSPIAAAGCEERHLPQAALYSNYANSRCKTNSGLPGVSRGMKQFFSEEKNQKHYVEPGGA